MIQIILLVNELNNFLFYVKTFTSTIVELTEFNVIAFICINAEPLVGTVIFIG